MIQNRSSTLAVREYTARKIRSEKLPQVVLVHGAMDRGLSFVRMVKLLTELGIDCISYDRRGYQDSILTEPFSRDNLPTIEDHVEDLAELVGSRSTIIFGHSLGGTIALLLAEQNRTPITAIVTFESPLPWLDFWKKEAAYGMELEDLEDIELAKNHAEAFMIRVLGSERWNKLPSNVKQRRRNEGLVLVSEIATATHRKPPLDPSRITIPCVIARGINSPHRYALASDYLTTRIPKTTTAIVDHTDHGIHLTNPTEATRLVELAFSIAVS